MCATSLKLPKQYIEPRFIQRLGASLQDAEQFKHEYACELAEERFVDILNPTSNAYRKGTILYENKQPIAVLKGIHQRTAIPFENNIYPEGIYWVDNNIYRQARSTFQKKNDWKNVHSDIIKLFPVRNLQGLQKRELSELLEKEYHLIRTVQESLE
jgi:hypothetical protein